MTRIGEVIAFHLGEVQQREQLGVRELQSHVDEAMARLADKERQAARRRALEAADRAGDVATVEALLREAEAEAKARRKAS